MGHFALIVCAVEPSPTQVLVPRQLEQLPTEYERAALEGLEFGLGDFPCQVQILDGLHHLVDSRVADFQRAGRMLAKEILAESRISKPSGARHPDLVRETWQKRWQLFQSRIRRELEIRLAPLGFHPETKGFRRTLGALRQIIELKGDSPILPAAADIKIWLECAQTQRNFGHLSLSRHLNAKDGTGPSPGWKLEDEESEKNLLDRLETNWIHNAIDPQWLLKHRPGGVFWWSALVEGRLLALDGRTAQAQDRVQEAIQKLEGKLGRAGELRELKALLAELS